MSLLITALYTLAILLTLPAVLVMLLAQPRKRAGLWQKLGFVPPRPGERPAVWLHAVSVGETLAAKTIVAALEARFPGHEVVISVTTRTGYDVARKTYPGHHVFYYPFDFLWSVRGALARIRPSAVLLVEQEVWPVFVRTCARRGIPTAVINGRITEKALKGLRRLRPLMGGAVRRVACFAMQTEAYAARIRALGVPAERVHVTGSVKYDTVETRLDQAAVARYRDLFGFTPDHQVLLAGSTHAGEDEALLAAFMTLRERFPALRLILVPRHPRRFDEVAALARASGRPWVRRSALDHASRREKSGAELVVVDTMGELAGMYGLADVVFVGGSLVPFGGHNMLDPAGLGKAVLFGPHVWNFSESARALIDAGGAVEVPDGDALTAEVERLLADPAAAAEMGRRGRDVVLQRRGATQRTLALVAPLIESPARGRRDAPDTPAP